MFGSDIWALIAGSILVSAAGYLFNDWIDVKADETNKPGKMYIQQWTKTTFYMTFGLFNLLALMLFFIVSPALVFWFMGVVILLVAYSLWLKRLPLIGNFIVSLLAAFSVYVVYLNFGTQDKNLVVFFASFAALMTYIREILKDMEDIDGDRLAGYKTFPIVTSITQGKAVVTLTSIFTVVIYSNLLWKWIIPQFSTPIKNVFMTYQGLCVILPILILTYLNSKARHKDDFTTLSTLSKYIMATGMCSILFF